MYLHVTLFSKRSSHCLATESHDFEACNLQLLSLEQSYVFCGHQFYA